MRNLLLIISLGIMILASSLWATDDRTIRLLANYHRAFIGERLLDLNTGYHVQCDTDMDCYLKTGINL